MGSKCLIGDQSTVVLEAKREEEPRPRNTASTNTCWNSNQESHTKPGAGWQRKKAQHVDKDDKEIFISTAGQVNHVMARNADISSHIKNTRYIKKHDFCQLNSE